MAVEAGEFVAIAGPNGGGKTTLCARRLGLERPTAGDRRSSSASRQRFRRALRIGYLAQRTQLGIDAPVTVREVVAAGGLATGGLLGPLRPRDRAIVAEAIERVGLTAKPAARFARLSGGQQQRAFIAKALAAEPELLVLDEPTTGVDVDAQEALAALLEELHRDLGVTILYVSHEFGAVERFVERLVLVRGGIVFDGDPAELPTSGTTPRMSMLDARVHAARLRGGRRSSACSRPAVGFFLVQRRMSLIGDGIGHVAFAGVAAGYLLGISPVATALVAAVGGAVAIEWLRARHRAAGDQALALVFYTGIAARRRPDLGRRGAEREPLRVPLRLDPHRHALRPHSCRWTWRGRVGTGGGSLPSSARCITRRGRSARRRCACRGAQRDACGPGCGDDRRLDADRRHPPDRGADGASR